MDVGPVVEFTLRAGPPGVTVFRVDDGAAGEETDVDETYTVVVDSPEEMTEVSVVVAVGRGQMGKTMVEDRKSVV